MEPINLKLFEGTENEDGDTKLKSIRVGLNKDGLFFIKVSAVSGTDPTLNVDIISYDEITEDWYVIGSFDEFTTTGKQALYIPGIGKEIGIQYAITGSAGQSFTWKASTILKD
ncbi:hypothetical protein ES705_36926 [subsurface metagenome]